MKILHIDLEPENKKYFVLACGRKQKWDDRRSILEQNVVLGWSLHLYRETKDIKFCKKCLLNPKLALLQLSIENL